MLNKILVVAILLLSNQSFSQYDGKERDVNSRFNPGVGWYYTGIRPAETERVRKYDRLIFDITYNDWVGDQNPFKGQPNSIGFSVNMMFDKPLTKGNTVSLGYGVQYKRNNIGYYAFLNSSDITKKTTYDTSFLTRKTRLIYNQFSIPLEIRFRKESWKHLKIHLGGSVGYAFRPLQKTKNQLPSGLLISKDYRFYDFDPLQYSTHVRIGLRNWALFGEYAFSKLFSSAESSQLQTIRMGVSISLY